MRKKRRRRREMKGKEECALVVGGMASWLLGGG